MLLKRYKSLLLTVIVLFAFTAAYATVPAGYYYFAKNKKKAALKTALHTYCGPMFEFDYGGGTGFTWQGFFYTDQNPDGSVVDMYSNNVRKFNGFAAVDGMHIEHSFPKSWWGAYENNAYKDLFHLYPADATTNITKSNLPLGEVTGTPSLDNGVTKIGGNGFESFYSDKCFEPADEYKGDFARSYFYISTIYENLAPLMQSPMIINNSTYPFWKPWALDLLMKWNKQDPVSPKELARIEAVYNIQGNRNPFIDYPDLADYIWGVDTTKVYPFPEETDPFLLTPRRGTTMDFGVLLKNDTRSKILHLQGVNINTAIQITLKQNSSALTLSTSSVSEQQALTGIDITVTFTPENIGFVHDTILVQGGGLAESVKIPVKALAASDFMTLEPKEISPIGGTLQWISEPTATDYHLKVYQNEDHAGDLIISAYVEGNSWNKALEIFNGTGNTVDLSKYSLKKQSNGEGDFVNEIQLSGTLQNFKSYILVNSRCTTSGLTSLANRLDSLINFNGNDAVVLTRGGVIIDQVGFADAGAAEYWGENISMERKIYVTHPSSKYNENEWTKLPIDTYSMLGNNQMAFTTGEPLILLDLLTGKVSEYPIADLTPVSTYTYSVEAVKPDGNTTAVNTMQLHTSVLDAPEISEASNVQNHQFTANWGVSAYANAYLLDVFEQTGAADTTEVEGFDNVGSTGSPLPDGWSGTATGNYTTITSAGITPPSLALKNMGEWVQTKSYQQSVSKMSFMYRFPTAILASSIIVEGFGNNTWSLIDSLQCVNTSKYTPSYTFDKSKDYKAFRWRFNKEGGGNLSLDDVSATYGNQETHYIQKDIQVSGNKLVISGLTENSTYYYAVRATLKGSFSAPSDIMSVVTNLNNKLEKNLSTNLRIISQNESVRILGLNENETVRIYSITGNCLYQTKAFGSEILVPFSPKGVFLLQVLSNNNSYTTKFVK